LTVVSASRLDTRQHSHSDRT